MGIVQDPKGEGSNQKILDRNPGPGKFMGKGMPRNYYAVTEYQD